MRNLGHPAFFYTARDVALQGYSLGRKKDPGFGVRNLGHPAGENETSVASFGRSERISEESGR